jgi:hypothetical protein
VGPGDPTKFFHLLNKPIGGYGATFICVNSIFVFLDVYWIFNTFLSHGA